MSLLSDRLTGTQLLDLVCDSGSFRSWDVPVPPRQRAEAYELELAKARERTGVDESVLTGEAYVDGRRVAIVMSEFGFLGGSIGVDAAARLVTAIERATDERLPLLAGPASGGTRLQEGTRAFVSMVDISGAIGRHKAAGLPYLVYLRHPTTGGVMSSWASLGHLTVAEPGALLGFLGPRVYEAITGKPFPKGVQTAENHYLHGLVDAIVPPKTLPRVVARALRTLAAAPDRPTPVRGDGHKDKAPPAQINAWDAVTASRSPARPGLRTLLDVAAEDVLPLSGTGRGEADHGILLALARFGDAPCIVIGHDRKEGKEGAPFGPAALRQAQRAVRLSRDLGLPLVSIIDTPGAELSKASEEGGLPGEIARTLADLIALPSPTVSVILGQGTGGGALASLPADKVLVAQHGWLAPLPPDGGAEILYRDPSRAPEVAASFGITAHDLVSDGIADGIIEELPDAADEPATFCRRVGDRIWMSIEELRAQSDAARLIARSARYRLSS